jgi:acyl carrier protein
MHPLYKDKGPLTVRVMEECAELIQILSKVARFGWFNYHPADAAKTPNYILVERELDDVRKRLDELEDEIDKVVTEHEQAQLEKIGDEVYRNMRWMLIDKFGLEAKDITPTAQLCNDLGLDSLDFVELIMHVESQYKISIDDTIAEEFRTVTDVCDYIRKTVTIDKDKKQSRKPKRTK